MLTEDAYENTTFYVTLPPKTCFCLRSTRHVIENEVIRRQLSSNRGQVCSLNCLNIGQMVLVLIGFVCEKIQRNKQRHNIVSMFSLLNYRYCVKRQVLSGDESQDTHGREVFCTFCRIFRPKCVCELNVQSCETVNA